MNVSLILPNQCYQINLSPYSNIIPFILNIFCPKSHSILFLFGLTVLQQFILFLVMVSNKSGEEKKLSMYNLWLFPGQFLLRSFTVAWLSVICYVTQSVLFKTHFHITCVPSWITWFKKILTLKRLWFLLGTAWKQLCLWRDKWFCLLPDAQMDCNISHKHCWSFQIYLAFSVVCHNFRQPYQFVSCCPQSVGSEGCVKISHFIVLLWKGV
jgi:hypothetical protein